MPETRPPAWAPAQLFRIRLLTIRQAAVLMERAPATVRRRLRAGRLQGTRVGGRWTVPSAQFLYGPDGLPASEAPVGG